MKGFRVLHIPLNTPDGSPNLLSISRLNNHIV